MLGAASQTPGEACCWVGGHSSELWPYTGSWIKVEVAALSQVYKVLNDDFYVCIPLQALESANKLLEEQKPDPFFKGYSLTSQLLEESFMDMLLLADSRSGDEVSKYTALLSDLKLDISEQLKSLQELDIPVGMLIFA